jgi:curved DNA-binding protein CbpA
MAVIFESTIEKDLYKILGVPASATQDDIKVAYRRLARENHPDANRGDAGKEERFKEVSEAYAVLSKAEGREEYTRRRKEWLAGQVRKARTPGGGTKPGDGADETAGADQAPETDQADQAAQAAQAARLRAEQLRRFQEQQRQARYAEQQAKRLTGLLRRAWSTVHSQGGSVADDQVRRQAEQRAAEARQRKELLAGKGMDMWFRSKGANHKGWESALLTAMAIWAAFYRLKSPARPNVTVNNYNGPVNYTIPVIQVNNPPRRNVMAIETYRVSGRAALAARAGLAARAESSPGTSIESAHRSLVAYKR